MGFCLNKQSGVSSSLQISTSQRLSINTLNSNSSGGLGHCATFLFCGEKKWRVFHIEKWMLTFFSPAVRCQREIWRQLLETRVCLWQAKWKDWKFWKLWLQTWMWWCTPGLSALWKLRQEDGCKSEAKHSEFPASLGYRVRSCFKITIQNKIIKC